MSSNHSQWTNKDTQVYVRTCEYESNSGAGEGSPMRIAEEDQQQVDVHVEAQNVDGDHHSHINNLFEEFPQVCHRSLTRQNFKTKEAQNLKT